MWIQRHIANTLRSAARVRAVVLITGARQTGKTSLTCKTFPRHRYVSLDLPRLAEDAEESGELFLQNHPAPLILDEVQYAPALFRYLKNAVDRGRMKPGGYLLTGSQRFGVMSGVSESLAGRVSVVELHSLSLLELEHWSHKTAEGKRLLQWIFLGGYPELHAKGLDPERFYADYVVTYLERDVRQALQIRNLRDFDRFMRLAAVRTGQLLSLSSFAADIGVSPNTIKSWLSVLEASQVVHLLEPYHHNVGKRIVKTPKLYFLDTGLACFLAGLRSADDVRSSALLGPLFESLVLGQLIRWHANRGKRPSLYFYRNHSGVEVDFVLPVGNQLKLYECKWAEHPPKEVPAFRHLRSIVGERNIRSQSLITPVRGTRTRGDRTIVEDCVELRSLEA
jgi:predicted AAA+ superfamily ATPase